LVVLNAKVVLAQAEDLAEKELGEKISFHKDIAQEVKKVARLDSIDTASVAPAAFYIKCSGGGYREKMAKLWSC
jgi:hypothetical protein